MVRLPRAARKYWSPARRRLAQLITIGLVVGIVTFWSTTLRPISVEGVQLPTELAIGIPSGMPTNAVTPTEDHRTAVSMSPGSPVIVVPSATSESTSVEPTVSATPTTTATIVAQQPTPEVQPTAAGSPAATTAQPAAVPRLVIPSIGVDAPVETKSLDADGVMQAPDSPAVVAWYDFSAQPGATGNTVFAGHLDFAGVGPAVFWHLSELVIGDEIEVINKNGTLVHYRVSSVRSYSATGDASAIVASTSDPTITLITCNGSYDRSKGEYDQRIVVTGDLVT